MGSARDASAMTISREAKMELRTRPSGSAIGRRAMLAATGAVVAAPALGADCRIGPPAHTRGPRVFMDYDQVDLDAAYNQEVYEPLLEQVSKRLYFKSAEVRSRLNAAQHAA